MIRRFEVVVTGNGIIEIDDEAKTGVLTLWGKQYTNKEIENLEGFKVLATFPVED